MAKVTSLRPFLAASVPELTWLQERWIIEQLKLDNPGTDDGHDEHFEERIRWMQEAETKLSNWEPKEEPVTPGVTRSDAEMYGELDDPSKWEPGQ